MSLTLWTAKPSGNAYKVRLLCAQLQLPLELVELDLFAGAARTPEFRERNPLGRVPVLQDGDFVLAESNAILLYLARGTPLLPADARAQAVIHQWMFFEQNQLELGLGVPRYYALRPMERIPALEAAFRARGNAGLNILEKHLGAHAWMAGEAYSVADIAVFAYTHVCPDGGFELATFPNVRAWIERVKGTPRFIAM